MQEQDAKAKQQFRLTFNGEMAPGANRDQVLEGLARLFSRPAQDLLPLMSGDLRVLKVAPSSEALEPFRIAMAKAGAIAHVRPPDAVDTPPPEVGKEPESAPAGGPPRYSLKEFLSATRQRDAGQGTFELEGSRFLEVNLDGEMWIKTGAMVARNGDIRFEREGLLEKGFKKLAKKSFTGEGARLTRASGIGSMYLADKGKKITILQLDGEALIVNGNDILAFEPSVEWDIRMTRKMSAVMAGGLFNVRLQGMGMVAITTHHDPLTLDVRHAYPVFSDPQATVAWSASLEPQFKTDVSLKTFLGRGSGESIQMCFEGEGFVVVQPFEEASFQR